jgi:hypothetical protein
MSYRSEISRINKMRHLVLATRQPFLDEIVAIYNRALPSILLHKSGEIAEYKYSQEVTDAVAKLRELMEEACKLAVESAQKMGEL